MQDLKVRKEWFIQSGACKIEDNYDISNKKVSLTPLIPGTRPRNIRKSHFGQTQGHQSLKSHQNHPKGQGEEPRKIRY